MSTVGPCKQSDYKLVQSSNAGAAAGYPVALFLPGDREIIYEASVGLGVEQPMQPDVTALWATKALEGICRVDLEELSPVVIYEAPIC